MADYIPKLGSAPSWDDRRDAIHVAVIPVTAGEDLKPGQPVEMNKERCAIGSFGDRVVGVVDPYLRWSVAKGERCWVMLLPGSITSLRHEWTHPAFPGEGTTAPNPTVAEVTAATARLQAMASSVINRDNGDDEAGSSEAEEAYRELIEAAGNAYAHGTQHTFYGAEGIYDVTDDQWRQFWQDWALVTGTVMTKAAPEGWYRCTC